MDKNQQNEADREANHHPPPKPPLTPRCLIVLGHGATLLPLRPGAKSKWHGLDETDDLPPISESAVHRFNGASVPGYATAQSVNSEDRPHSHSGRRSIKSKRAARVNCRS